MKLDKLVQHLTNPAHIGLTAELRERLGVASPDVVRGKLLAEVEEDHSHLGVYMLGCYVVDDTDFWSDGEIYWWSIPTLIGKDGKVQKSPIGGLPNGAPPHKCGDHEWMTNMSLGDPPLWAIIPPTEDVQSCVVRLGVYDDDGDVADMPGAMTAGHEAFAAISTEPLSGPEQIISPVREAIWTSLKADQDDILIEQDVPIRRGEVVRFGRGMIGAVINAMARVYYVVRDEDETVQFGPVSLDRGQIETVKFDIPMKRGGRVAVFARGADVSCTALGDLHTDVPFKNRVLTQKQEEELANGFNVVGSGPAKFIAYYTPAPRRDQS
ncbi:MAG: hypothetical protein JRI23_22560 [Deltaproteobacteria bacterium]|jgi:hypothetical protein|nr:hypothetical protein [Deltaproteobacteria bacterium]MBW2534744.1 hypothetical protein [Deltaproteobacteria bacterium]